MKALLVVLKVFAVLALLTMVAAASNAHPWLIEGLLHLNSTTVLPLDHRVCTGRGDMRGVT